MYILKVRKRGFRASESYEIVSRDFNRLENRLNEEVNKLVQREGHLVDFVEKIKEKDKINISAKHKINHFGNETFSVEKIEEI